MIFLALFISVGATYYRYIVFKQYDTFLTTEEVPSPWDMFTSYLWTQ